MYCLSCASSDTGLLAPLQVQVFSSSASESKRRSGSVDDGAVNILQALQSTDPMLRLEGIGEFRQLVENNNSLATANITKVFVGFSFVFISFFIDTVSNA